MSIAFYVHLSIANIMKYSRCAVVFDMKSKFDDTVSALHVGLTIDCCAIRLPHGINICMCYSCSGSGCLCRNNSCIVGVFTNITNHIH